jgi:hypothetical protein
MKNMGMIGNFLSGTGKVPQNYAGAIGKGASSALRWGAVGAAGAATYNAAADDNMSLAGPALLLGAAMGGLRGARAFNSSMGINRGSQAFKWGQKAMPGLEKLAGRASTWGDRFSDKASPWLGKSKWMNKTFGETPFANTLRGVPGGAALGGLAGGVYGTFSDRDSMFSGAFKGAVMGGLIGGATTGISGKSFGRLMSNKKGATIPTDLNKSAATKLAGMPYMNMTKNPSKYKSPGKITPTRFERYNPPAQSLWKNFNSQSIAEQTNNRFSVVDQLRNKKQNFANWSNKTISELTNKRYTAIN